MIIALIATNREGPDTGGIRTRKATPREPGPSREHSSPPLGPRTPGGPRGRRRPSRRHVGLACSGYPMAARSRTPSPRGLAEHPDPVRSKDQGAGGPSARRRAARGPEVGWSRPGSGRADVRLDKAGSGHSLRLSGPCPRGEPRSSRCSPWPPPGPRSSAGRWQSPSMSRWSGRPPGANVRRVRRIGIERRGSMGKVAAVIGIDISKRYFQLHGATAGGEPMLRKKLRARSCSVARLPGRDGSCASAYHWGRQIQELGRVRLIIGVCEALCEEAEERRQRRGSDRRGGSAADDAVRGREDRGGAGAIGGVPTPGSSSCTNGPRRSTRCGVTSRSSASSLRWDPQRRSAWRRRCAECVQASRRWRLARYGLIERIHDLDAAIDEMDREIRGS